MVHKLFDPVPLSRLPLDRNPHIRDEMKNIEDFQRRYLTMVVPCFGDHIAINTETFNLFDAPHDQWMIQAEQNQQLLYLGLCGEYACFAWSCHDFSQMDNQGFSWKNLRSLNKQLAAKQFGIAALAMGLARWHAQTRYCTKCAHPMERFLWGEGRICSNQDCKSIQYPSHLSPSMIALVTAQFDGQEKLLLIRHSDKRRTRWTLPSGFVSMGESIEDTVIREIFEETGVICRDVQYLASQPWSFGKSLMIGCQAKAVKTKITIDPKEIYQAQWISKAEIKALAEDQLAPLFSISRTMIRYWLSL